MPEKQRDLESALIKMEELYAKLYFHFATEYLRSFSGKGMNALKLAIKKYGEERGKANRAEHERCGYPIHLKTLFEASGFPGKAGFRRNLIDLQPHQRISETLECPLHNHWRELNGLKEGLVYCEVVHDAMWSAYDARIETRQPKIMTHGDELCRFEVYFDEAKGLPVAEKLHQPSTEEHLQRLLDLQAKLYYFLAHELIAEFGLDGEAAVRRAVRRFGRERGLQIREDHIKMGLELNLYNLFTHYDLPGDSRFRRNKIELTEETRLSETLECTFYNVWKNYPDGNSIGRIYCEEIHHQIFGAYHPAVQTNLCCTLTQGDDKCRFSVYFRPANTLPEPDWTQKSEIEKPST
jgi:hypothetical protein